MTINESGALTAPLLLCRFYRLNIGGFYLYAFKCPLEPFLCLVRVLYSK